MYYYFHWATPKSGKAGGRSFPWYATGRKLHDVGDAVWVTAVYKSSLYVLVLLLLLLLDPY